MCEEKTDQILTEEIDCLPMKKINIFYGNGIGYNHSRRNSPKDEGSDARNPRLSLQVVLCWCAGRGALDNFVHIALRTDAQR